MRVPCSELVHSFVPRTANNKKAKVAQKYVVPPKCIFIVVHVVGIGLNSAITSRCLKQNLSLEKSIKHDSNNVCKTS
jgi:hypothetical protein